MNWIDRLDDLLGRLPTGWLDDVAARLGTSPEIVAGLALVVAVVGAAMAGVAVRRRRRRAAAPPAEAEVEKAPAGDALARGLGKTRRGLLGRLAPLLGRREVDDAALEEMETALLLADVGVRTTERLLAGIRAQRDDSGAAVGDRLRRDLLAILEDAGTPVPASPADRPRVLLVVGVNGAGKTTSIGKLACRLTRAGRRVLLVAGDTFRAAAADQLAVWAERAGADIVRHQQGGDPGAVVYDGLRAALARKADVVIVDTAGRLHTRSNLMDELRKLRRIVAREIPGAPDETLLVLDAVTGQNGIVQARAFVKELGVDGVILTKLDGTAKGGVVVAIAGELGVPVRYIGIGEGVDDLRDFDARAFVEALLAPSRLDTQPDAPLDSR